MTPEQVKTLRLGDVIKVLVDTGIENCLVLSVDQDTGNVELIIEDRIGEQREYIPSISKTPPTIVDYKGRISLEKGLV